jgi:hypothetical protein
VSSHGTGNHDFQRDTVATFVKGWLIIQLTTLEDDEIEKDNILEDEIDSVRQAFAKILVLLDEIFPMLVRTPQRQVSTAELMAKLS